MAAGRSWAAVGDEAVNLAESQRRIHPQAWTEWAHHTAPAAPFDRASQRPAELNSTDSQLQRLMATVLDETVEAIHAIQRTARTVGDNIRPRWPMIVVHSPKGWTGPRSSTANRSRARSGPPRDVVEHRGS